MDFRTEWSSWILVAIMMVIAYIISPFDTPNNILLLVVQVIGLPLATIAIACIPVIIFCYFIKRIPDIDYAIYVAFTYMVILLVLHFI